MKHSEECTRLVRPSTTPQCVNVDMFIYMVNEAAAATVHTAFVALFETLFFFAYVVQRERIVLRRTFEKFISMVSYLCLALRTIVSFDDDEVVQAISRLDYVSNSNNEEEHNAMVVRVAAALAFFFAMGSGILCAITAWFPPKPEVRTVCRIVTSCALTSISIGFYEYLFFDLVISEYKPITGDEMIRDLLQTCSASASGAQLNHNQSSLSL